MFPAARCDGRHIVAAWKRVLKAMLVRSPAFADLAFLYEQNSGRHPSALFFEGSTGMAAVGVLATGPNLPNPAALCRGLVHISPYERAGERFGR